MDATGSAGTAGDSFGTAMRSGNHGVINVTGEHHPVSRHFSGQNSCHAGGTWASVSNRVALGTSSAEVQCSPTVLPDRRNRYAQTGGWYRAGGGDPARRKEIYSCDRDDESNRPPAAEHQHGQAPWLCATRGSGVA